MMPSVRVSTIIMIEMMSSLGGPALMSRNLIAATKSKKTVGGQLTPDEVEEGFNFIRSSGPASAVDSLKWALQQKVDAASPLTGWNLGWIERALANEREMSFLAKEVKDYPLTIKDLTNWVLTHVLFPILPDVKTNAVIWAGVPGVGKTPLANALANTVSSYWLNELGMPGTHGFKTANDIDFFRSEPGRVHTPVIFDDGEPWNQPVSLLKSFLDVSISVYTNTRTETIHLPPLRFYNLKYAVHAMHQCFPKAMKPSHVEFKRKQRNLD
eukprot:2396931-Amphidinium_carterae.1